MKKLWNALRVKSEPNPLLDLVISLLDGQDLSTMTKVAADSYSFGDATLTIRFFDPDAFEEMQISFGYSNGKGISVILRNYIDHTVVLNHAILDTYHTIEFPVSPETFAMQDYRERLDAIALRIVAAIGNVSDD